jgi:hypothetical protein
MIGKIFRQKGMDQHQYDGYTISLRTDLKDVGRLKAYLLDGDTSSNILIKDVKMSSILAHGKRVTSAPAAEADLAMDRSSILVQGQFPPHFVLLRFHPGTHLKNVFTPYQLDCRQIKKCSNVSQDGVNATESGPTVLGQFLDDSGSLVEIRKHVRTEHMHVFMQAMFCIAKGEPITRFAPLPANDDDEKELRDLLGRLGPISDGAGTPTPPTTSSSG